MTRRPRKGSLSDNSEDHTGSEDRSAFGTPENGHSPRDHFARVVVPIDLQDPEKRKKWELPPPGSAERGSYIIELNAQHLGGISGAESAFFALHKTEIEAQAGDAALGRPIRIGKSYYRCVFNDAEWRRLIAADQTMRPAERAIYRLWPDFPVEPCTDRSITTIKSDAALYSFSAAGEDIVWAVVDSGIEATHPHFGDMSTDQGLSDHLLVAEMVRDLHRNFADVFEKKSGIMVRAVPLDSPDWPPDLEPETRKERIARHRGLALRDEFGHGTHVAGIIAGEAPSPDRAGLRIFEHQFTVDQDGTKVSSNLNERFLRGRTSPRGVAPRCKLISLRVLDHLGKGRSSQVIEALEYLREKINDNPKLVRVHGVNLSVGYPFDPEMFACGQSPLCTTVNRLVQEGVVVVAAAGNTGHGSVPTASGPAKVAVSNSINDPGNADCAITVGATHRDSPHTYGVSYFSSKGPTADGRLKPDLVAPGERITSCAAGSKLDGLDQPQDRTACYVDDTGTSVAAPHVSGAIAAFLSIRREFIGRPLEVKRIFLESATPLGRERYFEGHGLVDLMRAIQSV